MFEPIQIILVCIYVCAASFVGLSTQWIGYAYPVLHGFFTGLLMGDVKMGLLVGGTMCLMSLGVGSFGGSAMPDYTLGSVIGTVFAIGTGGDLATALTVGIPVATLGTYMDVLVKMAGSFFLHKEMNCAQNHKFNQMGIWTHGWNLFRGVMIMLPVLLFMTLGSGLINAILNALPEWFMKGMNTAAGMLPAVGFAILLKYLPIKEYGVFLIFGFVLTAYLGMPILAISLLAFVAAFMVYKGLNRTGQTTENIAGGNYDE